MEDLQKQILRFKAIKARADLQSAPISPPPRFSGSTFCGQKRKRNLFFEKDLKN